MFVNFRGSPKRDPRTHTVSAGYACKVTAESLQRMQVRACSALASASSRAASLARAAVGLRKRTQCV